MMLLEGPKRFSPKTLLEDKRTEKQKLESDFERLAYQDKMLQYVGAFSVSRPRLWMQWRVKYSRRRVFNLGTWQVNWKNIEIGKK